jgi:glycosyltransferase involved in cell wall biosynthesis
MNTILLISPYWREQHRWMVSTVKLATLWQKLGYRVVVVCMGDETGVEHVSETLIIYRLKDVFLPDPWNYGIALGFSGTVMRLATEYKPRIIVVNKILFWSSFALLRLRMQGYHTILLTDALVGMTWFPRSALASICARIYAWTAGWLLLKRSTAVVFFHPQPEKLLNTLGITRKVRVIPTGIDTTHYHPKNTLPVVVDSRTTPDVVVTYIGRLESIKGVDDFLQAATEVKKEFRRMRIRIVGWYKEGHPLVVKYHDRVEFIGLMKESSEALEDTDIFVLPSHAEGLSNALMEAMSCGVACIASDVGGNRFLIENGVSGFLFPVGDRAALSAHIRRLIEDPHKRDALGKNARKRMEEHFSEEKVLSLYQKLFSEQIVQNG